MLDENALDRLVLSLRHPRLAQQRVNHERCSVVRILRRRVREACNDARDIVLKHRTDGKQVAQHNDVARNEALG